MLPLNGVGVEMPLYVVDSPEHFEELEKQIRAYAEPTLRGLRYGVAAIGGLSGPMILRQAGSDPPIS